MASVQCRGAEGHSDSSGDRKVAGVQCCERQSWARDEMTQQRLTVPVPPSPALPRLLSFLLSCASPPQARA